jgi:hypothetical protein
MRRAALWITSLGLGLVLAQRESVVHSPDGSLAPLTFGQMTCLRVVQGERALSGTTCVDLGNGGGSGVLRLPLSEGTLEVPYRVDSALGEVSYLIRLGAAWRWAPPAAPAGDPPVKEAAGTTPPPAAAPSVASPPQGDPPAREATTATPPAADPPVKEAASTIPSPQGDPPAKEREQPLRATDGRPPQEESPAPVNKRSPAAPVWSYFSLRKTPDGWQLVYSLLARTPVETPTSGIKLFLDGKPLAGKLTRRTTASTPGRLEAGQSEYGWIDLGPLEGSNLRLMWSLEGVSLEREWRLP